MNELSRELAEGRVGLAEAELQLAAARRIPFPGAGRPDPERDGGLGSLCPDVRRGPGRGGGGRPCGVQPSASTCGPAGGCPPSFLKLTGAGLITLVCILACGVLAASVNHAAIGALMILTPGVAFTMSIRDFVKGDYLSGTIRLIDAVLVAACLACGAGLVLRVHTLLTGVTVV